MVIRIVDKASCQVFQKGGILYDSVGSLLGSRGYVLRTLGSSRVITLPWVIDSAGPAQLESSALNCSSYLFLQPKIHFLWIVPALLFLMVLLSVPLVVRFLKFKSEIRKCGFKYKFSCPNLILKGPIGKRHIRLWTFFLYLICLRGSYTVDGCINITRYVGNNTLFAVNAWPGESICTRDSNLQLSSPVIKYPLLLKYETSDWVHNRTATWGCASGSCPPVDECQSLRGKLHQEKGKLEKFFCDTYPAGCALGRGCWFGSDTINYDERLSVFSIGGNIQNDFFEISNKGCHVVRSTTSYIQLPNINIIASISEGKSWLCKDVAERGEPLPGMIGSLQLLKSDIKFSWESVKCDSDWFSSQKCKIDVPPSIEKSCSALPTTFMQLRFSVYGGVLTVEQSFQSATYIGQCSGKLISKDDECYGEEIHVIGKRELGEGLSIRARANSKDGKGFKIITINCNSNEEIHLQCDGKFHFYPLSELTNCKGVDDISELQEEFSDTVMVEDDSHIITTLGLHDPINALKASGYLSLLIVFLIITLLCKK